MALPSTLNPASPASSDNPGQGDDQIRAFKQLIADLFGIPTDPTSLTAAATSISAGGVISLTAALNEFHGADIASAATLNLETATGNIVDVTGTTTITAITLSEGHRRVTRFTGALTLTNGASLVLLGGVNITTVAGDYAVWIGYAAGVVRMEAFSRPAAIQPIVGGGIFGLTLSNSGGDPTNDIDVAVGQAVDSTSVRTMKLASGLTKQLDAAWAVGTAAGMLDTGAIGNGTYHIFLIQRSDTGVVDILASLSATAPTMPAAGAYDFKRRIGSILREAAAIVLFTQNGDSFQRTTSVGDISTSNPGTAAVTRTLSVPTGIKVQADVVAGGSNADAGSGAYFYFSDLATTDSTPAGGLTEFGRLQNTAGLTDENYAQKYIYTNTSAQIRSRVSFSSVDVTMTIRTFGWIDRRNRDA